MRIFLLFFTLLLFNSLQANPPTLFSPGNNATNQHINVNLDWGFVSGNSGYAVELDTLPTFNSAANDTLHAGSSNLQLNNLRFGTTYYWRVATKNSSGQSAWSVSRSFTTLDGVSLLSPPNGASNQHISLNLDWSTAFGSSGYILQYDTVSTFNSTALTSSNRGGSSGQVSNLFFNTQYFWRVAVKSANDTSAWSTVRNFSTLSSPSPTRPSNGSTQSIGVTLDWTVVSGNSGYILEVDSSQLFNSPLLAVYNPGISEQTVNGLRFGTTYYWRAAVKSSNDTSNWTVVRSFNTLDRVNLFSPSDQATNQGIRTTLDWGFISGHNGYICELDTNPTFNSPIFQRYNPGISEQEVNGLRFGTTYYWRAAAKSLNDTSQWSSIRSFTTLNAVNPLSPANQAINVTPSVTLDWVFANGNNGYICEIDTSPNFTSPSFTRYNPGISEQEINGLRFGTTYYWRAAVKSVNDTSDWTSLRSFTTLDQVIPFSPFNNVNNQNIRLVLDWNSINGNSGYLCELDTNPNFNSPLYRFYSPGISRQTVGDLRFGTTYYWRAAVKTTNDTSQWSSVRTFNTRDGLSLQSPGNNSINRPVSLNLDWAPVSYNQGYLYQIDTDPNFNSTDLIQKTSAQNSSQGSISGLNYGTQYFWRAAVKSNNDTSSWSSTWNFTTAFLLANPANLISPANNSSGLPLTSIAFDWDTVPGATNYDIQVSTSSSFNTLSHLSTINNSNHVFNNFQNNTTYYWRVRGSDNTGNSPWSATWVFTTLNCNTTASITISSCGEYSSPSGKYTYSTSGVFFDTLTNAVACDSIITINLTVNQDSRDTISPVACDSYLSPSGKYIWSSSGNFHDTINNSAGCDSLLYIQLTVNSSSRDTINPVACGSYTSPSGNYNWTSSGSYFDTLRNAVGCDSVILVQLTINPIQNTSISPVVCDFYTSPSGKYTFTVSGNYQDTLTNQFGCDSILTITLTINQSKQDTINPVVCGNYTSPSGKYSWSTSGNYLDTLPTQAGCDSVLFIQLQVDPEFRDTLVTTACEAYTSPSGRFTFTSSGNYLDTLIAQNGCDSILYIQLTVNQSSGDTINPVACGSYTSPSGRFNWTSSGNYFDTLSNADGCDSVILVQLTVNPTYQVSVSDTICSGDSYTFPDGNTLSMLIADTVYLSTLQSTLGCDSLINTDLKVNPLPQADGGADQSICWGDTVRLGTVPLSNTSYNWSPVTSISDPNLSDPFAWPSQNRTYFLRVQDSFGCQNFDTVIVLVDSINKQVFQLGDSLQAVSTQGSYQWLDCNANLAPIPGETNRLFVPVQSGDYAVSIQQNQCIDTSICNNVLVVGNSKRIANRMVKFYPNPANELLTIELGDLAAEQITLYDLSGKQLLQESIISGRKKLELNVSQLRKGIYIIQLSKAAGIERIRFIKQ